MIRLACILGLLVATGAWAQNPATSAWRVTIVPFVPLSREVPAHLGLKAAAMLSNELKNTPQLELVEPASTAVTGGTPESLERARQAVEQGQSLRKELQFRRAHDSLQEAIGQFLEAAPALKETGELAEAYVLLSSVQFNTGRDQEADQSLRSALFLAPRRDFALVRS